MADLDEILSSPIRWRDWDRSSDLLAFLSDLQANILKGHGRDHTANMFLSFADMNAQQITELLRKLSFLVTSALDQLRSAEAFKLTQVSGGRIICVFLARGAYQKLNIQGDSLPSNSAFLAGMRERGRLPQLRFANIEFDFPSINDPAPDDWESDGAWSPRNPEPDAMLLIADDSANMVDASILSVQRVLNGTGCVVTGIDKGLAQRRLQSEGDPKGEGIEHFGYVDGRSQPLFLAEDIDREPGQNWSPTFPPSQFILADPSRCTDVAAGSYFVYRKLEQNVKRFKEQEDALADRLPGSIDDRAGAMVVGRFEDGTPAVLLQPPRAGNPINDFNYSNDQAMPTACPFRAHIRKTNPRSVPEDPLERSRLMARRGITYGPRKDREPGADFPANDRPEKDVGLLFMAYMADISEQFEFTQSAWANNSEFEHPLTGIDPVIGQADNPSAAHTEWHDKMSGAQTEFDFKTCVTLKGGDYFFAPSISFLQRGP